MVVTTPGAPAERCVPQELTIDHVELAHAYVPFQKLCPTFTPMGGLMHGTIFPALSGLYWYENGRSVYEDDQR